MFSDPVFRAGDWIVEKIVTLRGKASNRLAKLVVLAGLALVVELIWAPYLEAFVVRHFSVSIETDSASWIGLVLVLFGLTYHYLSTKLQRGELHFFDSRENEHDSQILNSLVIEHSTERVRDCIQWTITHDSYNNSQLEVLIFWQQRLLMPEYRFLQSELR